MSSREKSGEKVPPESSSENVFEHQQQSIAQQEPFDALRRDAEALGVDLFLSLPLPDPGSKEERYYADWLDEEGRRQPALDFDIFLWTDPIGLMGRSLEAIAGQDEPRSEIVVLDEHLAEVARLSP